MEAAPPAEPVRENSASTPDRRRSWIVQFVGYAVAIGSASALWLGICAATGEREAWDSSVYFTFGVPALTIVSAALGFFLVHHPWRWAPIMVVTQFTVMVISEGLGVFFVAGILFLLGLAIPAHLAAHLGSFIARRLMAR